MNTISIPTTQNIELEYPIAGPQERMLSGFIDLMVLGLYLFGFHYLLDEYSKMDFREVFLEDNQTSRSILYFLLWIPAMFYSLFCESLFGGQTLGKWLTRTRTIRINGATPDTAAYFLRWLFRVIDVWSLTGISGYAFFFRNYSFSLVLFGLLSGWVGIIFIAVTRYNQRLGDILAGTTVIKLRLVTTFLDTIYVQTSDDYQLVFPEIRSLSDRDVSILKEVLDVGLKSKNPDLIEKLARKVKDVTGIQSNMNSGQFLRTVLADYNHFFGKKS